jgi:aminoglycoside 3-N-acetyltransferase I
MSFPQTEIRRLAPTDVMLARKLNTLFGDAFADVETYTLEPPSDAHLEDLLAKEHVIVLVALAGEAVLGGLVAYELDKMEQARREIYIYDLAVGEEHRRQGIASALIGFLCRIVEQRGVWTAFVQADYGDDPAIALYQKFGTREDVLHFDLNIEAWRRFAS